VTSSIPLPPIAGLPAAIDSDVRQLVELYDRLRQELGTAVIENLKELETDESWALLHAMNERCMEQQAACISLYSNKYFAPAEALCRTVVEAAVNLYYSSIGDSCTHVLTYFRSYIEMERKQNRSWLASVNASAYPEEVKNTHRQRIQNKDVALNTYEHVLTEAFSQIGIAYGDVGRDWPSIFDRFKSINKEVEYRTVYAALCSQAHNDAEDLLNDFVHGVRQIGGAHESQAAEDQNFSLYMVLTALSFLAEATVIYLAKFNLDVNERFQRLLVDIWAFTAAVTQRNHLAFGAR
jgi:hypothetical protein